jgi:hypothetical protein
MRLTKDQSRRRWAQIRDLWNDWDPIGVTALSDWPRDEYDAYLGPSLRLLESGASLQALRDYLADVELNRMGLSESPQAQKARLQFAAKLREWYEKHWAGSTV